MSKFDKAAAEALGWHFVLAVPARRWPFSDTIMPPLGKVSTARGMRATISDTRASSNTSQAYGTTALTAISSSSAQT
jgi:hypothetical protein